MKINPKRKDCQASKSPVPIGEKKAKERTVYKANMGGDNKKEIPRAIRRHSGEGVDSLDMKSARPQDLRPSYLKLEKGFYLMTLDPEKLINSS